MADFRKLINSLNTFMVGSPTRPIERTEVSPVDLNIAIDHLCSWKNNVLPKTCSMLQHFRDRIFHVGGLTVLTGNFLFPGQASELGGQQHQGWRRLTKLWHSPLP